MKPSYTGCLLSLHTQPDHLASLFSHAIKPFYTASPLNTASLFSIPRQPPNTATYLRLLTRPPNTASTLPRQPFHLSSPCSLATLPPYSAESLSLPTAAPHNTASSFNFPTQVLLSFPLQPTHTASIHILQAQLLHSAFPHSLSTKQSLYLTFPYIIPPTSSHTASKHPYSALPLSLSTQPQDTTSSHSLSN